MASQATSVSLPTTAYDRAFYSGMAVLLTTIVLVGFGPTFYLRGLFAPAASITGSVALAPLTMVHGFVFSAWVLLFLVQTSLIASRRVSLHRSLGYAGVVLAALMVVVGLATAFAAAARGSAPPGVEPLVFLVVPVFDIVLFVAFLVPAVLRRREKEAHKRLMLLAYIAIIPAAVARMPGVFSLGVFGLFGLSFLLAVVAAAYDYWSRRRVSPIYWWGIALLFLSVPIRLAVSSTAAWMAFASYVSRN